MDVEESGESRKHAMDIIDLQERDQKYNDDDRMELERTTKIYDEFVKGNGDKITILNIFLYYN